MMWLRTLFILWLLALPASGQSFLLRWSPLQWTNFVRSLSGSNSANATRVTGSNHVSVVSNAGPAFLVYDTGLVTTAELASATNGYYRSRWTTNADGTTINGAPLTNAVGLAPGTLITITTNSGRLFTINAAAAVLAELTNGAVSHEWATSEVDVPYTNILFSYTIPVTGLYTVNYSGYTLTSLPYTSLDSTSWLYVIWTEPNGRRYTNNAIDVRWASGDTANYISDRSPLTYACQAGTTLVVSNYSTGSFSPVDGDTPGTNYVRASLWGRLQ